MTSGEERLLLLEEVEALLASNAFVVDACRHVVRDARKTVSLARRPVLFALARALGEAWPGDVPTDTLVASAFGSRRADESHRARLRVEVGRLRAVLRALADVSARKRPARRPADRIIRRPDPAGRRSRRGQTFGRWAVSLSDAVGTARATHSEWRNGLLARHVLRSETRGNENLGPSRKSRLKRARLHRTDRHARRFG